MRIHEALSPAKWIEVPFAGGAILRVRYRPSNATIAELQAMSTEGSQDEKIERVITTFLDLVIDWDLTEEDGETKVSLTKERLMNIPANIFRAVITAVHKDQSAGEAGSSSVDG